MNCAYGMYDFDKPFIFMNVAYVMLRTEVAQYA